MDKWFQKVCCKITKHKLRKCIAWSEGITPTEYHYRCLICGKRFWNHTPNKKLAKKECNNEEN